ncbi:MAG TPA: glycosyltransferase [Candidatus Omnitrophota bacterium]|nr:glycosyltransferase [Candidatus Omnitrophota bacterium]HPT07766.1 glycosyltransferase [Candidatus Omnitrophota bacterium]
MKILITHASAGGGHTKAAEAINEYLTTHRKDCQVTLVDITDYAGSLLQFSYHWGYTFLINNTPSLWGVGFWLTYCTYLRFLSRPIAEFFNALNTRKLARFFISENPDYIVSTHFLPSEIAAKLKRSKKITSTVITVITDYAVHPFWITDGTDQYIVASEYTKKIAIQEGIPAERIKICGIPVSQKFSGVLERKTIAEKLTINPDMFTVLISTGSFGIGPAEALIKELSNQIQIIMVCANNKELYDRLKSKNYPNCFVYGFVSNMHELMAVSDVIVAKPGGMTVSEALAMRLYPIFFTAIPGQENENVRFLASHGIGIMTSNVLRIKEIILGFKTDPGSLAHLKSKIDAIKKPRAAGEIADALC